MNREALKQLACLGIDSQAAQKIGNKVFVGNYIDQELIDFRACMDDIATQIDIIITMIPTSDT